MEEQQNLEENVVEIPTEEPLNNIFKNKKLIIVLVILVVLVLFVVVFFSIAKTQKPKTIVITSKEQDSTIHVKPNDVINIQTDTFPDLILTSDMSDPSVVKQEGSKNNNGNFTGSFKADKPGDTDILVEGRPPCKTTICSPITVSVYHVHIIVDK